MKIRFRTIVAGAVPVALLTIVVWAQSMPTATPSASPSTSSAASPTPITSAQPTPQQLLMSLHDAEILNFIQHVNQAELNMATSAAGRLQSPQNQSINQIILQDHQSSFSQVENVATTLNIPVYSFQLATYELAEVNGLNSLPESAFDQGYLDVEKADHQSAIQRLQQMQRESASPQVQQVISSVLPVMQKHLALLSNPSTAPMPSPAAASPSPSATASP